MRALAVIDGEHYPPVVRDALVELPYEFVAAWMAGGTEKLRGDFEVGVPIEADLGEALAVHDPELVVDLSDEPVLGPRERFRVASRVLARGIPYRGPDFVLQPPFLAPFALPSLSIVGTGKRVGKTAVAGHVARLLAADRDVVVVAMGRGGPREPELAAERPGADELLRLSRDGHHAASDYLEDAALAGVVTVGCRRCGGGLAGTPAISNVLEGAEVAAARSPDLVVFEGSGAAFPPIQTDARILVAGAHQPPELVTGYLNAYRILVSDLVVLTGADSPPDALREAIQQVSDIPVVATALRARPIEPVAGARVAFFTTAPERTHERLAEQLAADHEADVVLVSGNLARREQLARDLDGLEADVYLTEIKAAAVDVVAEAAAERGARLVFCDNDVVPLEGEPDLDAAVRSLAEQAAGARV